MLPAGTLAAFQVIETVLPTVNVPEVGPVRVKVGAGAAWMVIDWVRWE